MWPLWHGISSQMRDDPRFSVLQQRRAAPVSGSDLECMGKSAAEGWSSGLYSSLHDAVVGTVKCARLSPEQVKRVVEFANTAAYLSEFRKEGAGHKYIDFGEAGPANPSTVLQDLNDGGGGTMFDTGSGSAEDAYKVPPTPYNPVDDDAPAEKTASASGIWFEGDPLVEVYALRDELEGRAGHVKEARRQEERNHEYFAEDLYNEVKKAALSGYSLGEIVHVLNSVADDGVFVKAAMSGMLEPLVDQGVYLSFERLQESLVKEGSGTPDVTHPLVHSFRGYCSSLVKTASLREEEKELLGGVAELNSFLRKQAAGGLVGAAKEMFRHSADVGGYVGHHAGRLIGGSGGAARFGKGVGRLAGYAAPVVAAHELYRRTLKGSPTYQSLKGTALSVVPGTQEYYAAEQPSMDPYAMMGGY